MSILLGEPDAERFDQALFDHRADASVTAANLLEARLIVEARNPETGTYDLQALLDVYDIAVEPVTRELIDVAFRGWKRFGKGRHAAALNYGDCFSYALAKQRSVPLLFKGNDFTQTDIASVLD